MANKPTMPEGTQFGAYLIARALGQGAFGTVYEAQQAPLNKRVALKVLHAEQAHQPESVGRFLQEAETAAKVRHPHIVHVYDVGAVDGIPFLAMEFLQGETLTARLRRERALSPGKALEVLLPVLSAVAALHDRGIVHRDLKPENVFLTRGPGGVVHPKLLDFGVAKGGDTSFAKTRTGMLLGTPYFMSPEQARESKHVDARSDQWALGVMLYECLSGAKPFDGDSLLVLLKKITEEPPTPLRLLVPTLPAALEAVVLRALEKDRARRHPTLREFGCGLLPFASARAREFWGPEFDPRLSPEDQAPTVALAASRPSGPPKLGATQEVPAPVPLVRQPTAPGVPGVPSSFPDPAETMRKAAMEVSRERPRTPVPASPGSSRGWVYATGGVLGAGALAAGLFFLVGSASRHPSPATTEPGDAAPLVTPTPEFTLELRAEPPSTHLAVDGVTRGEGSLRVRLEGGARRHELRASADGYNTVLLFFDEAHPPPSVVRLTPLVAPTPGLQPPGTTTPPPAPPLQPPPPSSRPGQGTAGHRTNRPQINSNGPGNFPGTAVFPPAPPSMVPMAPASPPTSPTTSTGIPIR